MVKIGCLLSINDDPLEPQLIRRSPFDPADGQP
jgi:hypothetical protein